MQPRHLNLWSKLVRYTLAFILFALSVTSLSVSALANIETSQTSVATIDVVTDFRSPVGVNNLTLGTQIESWMGFSEQDALKQAARKVGFGLLRIFVNDFQPSTQWDEGTHTGIYDWSRFDAVLQAILDTGGEPLLCIDLSPSAVPPGMYIDPSTQLPSIDSAAQYSGMLARHVVDKGFRVHYWEILNEPQYYLPAFATPNPDPGAFALIVNVFNEMAKEIHKILPDALCGIDCSNVKTFLEVFAQYGQGVGFLAFHKYDSGDPPYCAWYSDNEVLQRAGSGSPQCLENTYTPLQMRQFWKAKRAVELPIICSETNLNWAYKTGTDPRIQRIIGAVWYSEEIRSFAQMGLRHSIYYEFASSRNWETKNKQSGGWGFGMIDCDTHAEWYPYLVNYLIANNLKYGDPLFAITSGNPTLSALAWTSADGYKILLINKASSTSMVNIEGLAAGELKVYMIDSASESIQYQAIEPHELGLAGYAVALVTLEYQSATYQLTIGTRTVMGAALPGVLISVDGTAHATPFSLTLQGTHSCSARAIPMSDGKLYRFIGWENEGGTVVSASVTLTCTANSANMILYAVYAPQ